MRAFDLEEYTDVLVAHCDADGRSNPGPVAQWRTWWRVAGRRAVQDRPYLRVAAQQGFAMTTEQLRAAGVSRQRTRTLVAAGTWSSPQPGVVSVVDPRLDLGIGGSDEWTVARRRHALDCAAAALLNRDHTASAVSAATMHGLPTLGRPGQPTLNAPLDLHAHRHRTAGIDEREIGTWFGTPLTGPARTVVDIARLDRRGGIVVADAALREHVTDLPRLRRALDREVGWCGVRTAREMVAFADGRSESPLESITRLALHDSGFPPPVPQFVIPVPGRTVPYRVDFCWPELRLVLECDGRIKYREDDRWNEKRRERDLRRLGYRVERVTWSDVMNDWLVTEMYLRPLFTPLPFAG